MTLRDFRVHFQRQFGTPYGYHYIIFEDGTVGQLTPDNIIGNHCRGHNADSIGVAYVGGLIADGVTQDTRTAAQREAMQTLIFSLIDRYHCPVHGHSYYNHAKPCPCFEAEIYNRMYAARPKPSCSAPSL